MVAEDDSKGAWHGDTVGRYSTFIACSFRVLAKQNGREAQELQRLMVFVAALAPMIKCI